VSLTNADEMFLYVARYASPEEAELDYQTIKDLHSAEVIGTYDAAVVMKTDDDKVKILHHTEKPTEHGGMAGLGVGALVGLIWPGVIIGAAVGAAIGAIAGHLEGGISRGELKELGEQLDDGQAAVIVIAEPTLERAVEAAIVNANRQMKKQVKANAKDVKEAIDASAG
jgi:uncharacterized membrane protein